MAELAQDSQYLAMRESQQARINSLEQECKADERGLVAEAIASGHEIESVWDFVNNAPHPFLRRVFIGPYPGAYPLLVRHLDVPHHKRTREGIVRALTVKDGGPAVEAALLKAFFEETDTNLRWVLANALRVAVPYHRRRKWPEIARVYEKGA